LFDPAVNDQCGGGQDQQDGKNDQVFLVAVEKHLEGVGPLRDFGKWHGGLLWVGGHGGRESLLRKADQSADQPEINAEVSANVDFRDLASQTGDFHRHQ
jgi:hypothetical protein